MTQKNSLTSVPDNAMLTLFKSLARFMAEEAQIRGWSDVTERLKAVQKALGGPAD